MKISIFPGKYHQNGGFFMAMLVSGRVYPKRTNRNTKRINGIFRDPQGHKAYPCGKPYYPYKLPISLGIRRWEWYGILLTIIGGPMSLGVPGITFKTIFPTYVVGSKLGNCPSQKLADDAMTPQAKDETIRPTELS